MKNTIFLVEEILNGFTLETNIHEFDLLVVYNAEDAKVLCERILNVTANGISCSGIYRLNEDGTKWEQDNTNAAEIWDLIREETGE